MEKKMETILISFYRAFGVLASTFKCVPCSYIVVI